MSFFSVIRITFTIKCGWKFSWLISKSSGTAQMFHGKWNLKSVQWCHFVVCQIRFHAIYFSSCFFLGFFLWAFRCVQHCMFSSWTQQPTGSQCPARGGLTLHSNGKGTAIVCVFVVHTFVPLSFFLHSAKTKTVCHLASSLTPIK